MEIINKEQKQTAPPKQPHRNSHQRNLSTGQGHAASGIILILAGLVLLLANFDIIQGNVSRYLFNWKTILIVLGIIFIGAKDNKMPGYILLGLGVIFWLPQLVGGHYITLRDVFWPTILILIGLLMITRHQGFFKHGRGGTGGNSEAQKGYLNDISIFSGGAKIIKSEDFKGGNITAIFGGSEFDLRQVTLDSDGAVLDIVTIFGGTKFIVPEDWNVNPDAVSILGGISDKRAVRITDENSGKTLIIKGVIILGGVEIKSF